MCQAFNDAAIVPLTTGRQNRLMPVALLPVPPTPAPSPPASLIWFRRDLRLTDNATLQAAATHGQPCHAVFVFDTDILGQLENRADRRVEFIWHSVAALKLDIEAQGGTLQVLHGSPRTLIPALAAQLGVNAVFAGRDYEPAAVARDAEVATALIAQGAQLHRVKDLVVFETDEILNGNERPFQVFTPYKRAWLARYAAAQQPENSSQNPNTTPTPTPVLWAAPRAPAAMLSLTEVGFLPTNLLQLGIQPGEAGAATLWTDFQTRIGRYRETRDFPAVKGPSYLSVHLRFGTVSVRQLARFAWEVAQAQGNTGAETWLSELIWREFYQMLLWHAPQTVSQPYQSKFAALVWPNPPGHFEAWAEARTGYPIVDAAMRQLNQTGYMHNRLRMIAASFLTKDLHVDWRLGEAYFAKTLLDYDQAANIGGWQWSASVGTDAQPWFRVFNPVTQSRKFDPHGRFIRRYLPELAAVPDQWLHAPWTMPASEQAQCGVCVGRDYPPPIVDHAAARAFTLELFRKLAPSAHA